MSHIQKILSVFQQLTSNKSSGLILLPENYKCLFFFFPAFFFLPCIKWQKMEREPSSFVLLTVGNKTQKSKVRLFNSSAFTRYFPSSGWLSSKYPLGREGILVELMGGAVVGVIAAESGSGTMCHWLVVMEGVWSAAVHMCSSMPVSKSSCWPRHSSSIDLQSSSWFLRTGCHLHQAGLYSFLRAFPGSCVSQFYYFVLWSLVWFGFRLRQGKSAFPPLHFQFIFHYLKITFASWVSATAELCPPSSCHVHCPAAGCGWALCSFGFPTNRNKSCWLHMSIPDWYLFSFVPSTCSTQKLGSACIFTLWLSLSLSHHLPLLSQARLPGFPCSFPLAASTHGLAGTAGLQSSHSIFHLWSGWCWSCALLLFPRVLTPETAPPAFLPFPVSSLQLWELA